MKSGLTFIDAKERNKQNPGTYPVPNDEQLQKLWKRDSVKIGVESFRDQGSDKKVVGDERFWVKVRKMRGQEIEGVISTDPLFTAQHGLKHGDTVAFEQRHIMEALIYDCPQCKHRDQMGYDIPEDELTPGIAKLLCPNCHAELPFEKLGCSIERDQLVDLCVHVADGLEGHPWKHAFRLVEEFCQNEGIASEPVLRWLREQDAACDCKVILNVIPLVADKA